MRILTTTIPTIIQATRNKIDVKEKTKAKVKRAETPDFSPFLDSSEEISPGKSNQDFHFLIDADTQVASPYMGSGQLNQGIERNFYDNVFGLIKEKHLHEAHEFRRKGHNKQHPKVNPSLLKKLENEVKVLDEETKKAKLSNWKLKLPDDFFRCVHSLKQITTKLSKNNITDWITAEIKHAESGKEHTKFYEMGSRKDAQSLARRLEGTIKALTRVAISLKQLGIYADQDTLYDMAINMLIQEIADISNGTTAEDQYMRVKNELKTLENKKIVDNEKADWLQLIGIRVESLKVCRSEELKNTIEAVKYEIKKNNIKNGSINKFSNPDESHSKETERLFSDTSALFSKVINALENQRQSLERSLLSESKPVSDEGYAKNMYGDGPSFIERTRKKALQSSQKILPVTRAILYKSSVAVLSPVTKLSDAIEFNPVIPDGAVVYPAVRSMLWTLQQPVIQLELGSQSLCVIAKELKKINGAFLIKESSVGTPDSEAVSDAYQTTMADTPASVSDIIKEMVDKEKPEAKQAVKLAVLNQLLKSKIDAAQRASDCIVHSEVEARFKEKLIRMAQAFLEYIPNDSQNMQLIINRLTEQLLPPFVKDLAESVDMLNKAIHAAKKDPPDFAAAADYAELSYLHAMEIKEHLSAISANITGKGLDASSRGERLAKHWAMIAKEQLSNEDADHVSLQPPDVREMLSQLKKNGLLEGITSAGDPEGFLFATRLAEEFKNAANNELKLPMSPDEYVALEKNFIEFMVNWGQRRLTRGAARIVVELCFDATVDFVSIGLSSMIRMPYKVVKAIIKVPYKINKVNDHIMPGQDKPYKAIHSMLEKNLKKLGFNLITAPIPGVIKSGIGLGIAASGHAYNQVISKQESTFSAVYEKVAEGKKSRELRISSAKSMAVDSIIDAAGSSVILGTQRSAIQCDHENKSQPMGMVSKENNKAGFEEYLGVTIEGTADFIAANRRVLDELNGLESGQLLLRELQDRKMRIRYPSDENDFLYIANGIKHYSGSTERNIIYFDPFEENTAPPAIVLGHEMLHLYQAKYPIDIKLDDGSLRTLDGDGQNAEEHSIVGGKKEYQFLGGTVRNFSAVEMQKYRVGGIKHITENMLREEFYTQRGETPILRESYGTDPLDDEYVDDSGRMARYDEAKVSPFTDTDCHKLKNRLETIRNSRLLTSEQKEHAYANRINEASREEAWVEDQVKNEVVKVAFKELSDDEQARLAQSPRQVKTRYGVLPWEYVLAHSAGQYKLFDSTDLTDISGEKHPCIDLLNKLAGKLDHLQIERARFHLKYRSIPSWERYLLKEYKTKIEDLTPEQRKKWTLDTEVTIKYYQRGLVVSSGQFTGGPPELPPTIEKMTLADYLTKRAHRKVILDDMIYKFEIIDDGFPDSLKNTLNQWNVEENYQSLLINQKNLYKNKIAPVLNSIAREYILPGDKAYLVETEYGASDQFIAVEHNGKGKLYNLYTGETMAWPGLLNTKTDFFDFANTQTPRKIIHDRVLKNRPESLQVRSRSHDWKGEHQTIKVNGRRIYDSSSEAMVGIRFVPISQGEIGKMLFERGFDIYLKDVDYHFKTPNELALEKGMEIMRKLAIPFGIATAPLSFGLSLSLGLLFEAIPEIVTAATSDDPEVADQGMKDLIKNSMLSIAIPFGINRAIKTTRGLLKVGSEARAKLLSGIAPEKLTVFTKKLNLALKDERLLRIIFEEAKQQRSQFQRQMEGYIERKTGQNITSSHIYFNEAWQMRSHFRLPDGQNVKPSKPGPSGVQASVNAERGLSPNPGLVKPKVRDYPDKKEFDQAMRKYANEKGTTQRLEATEAGTSLLEGRRLKAIGKLDMFRSSHPELVKKIKTDPSANFTLTTMDGDPAETLMLSSHGWFTKESRDTLVPMGKDLIFLGPHGQVLLEAPESAYFLPAQKLLDGTEYPVIYSHLRNKASVGGQDSFAFTELNAGTTTDSWVKNYNIKHYEKMQEEEAQLAVLNNRISNSQSKMDLITVNNEAGDSQTLKDLLDQMKRGGRYSQYKQLVFSACREEKMPGTLISLKTGLGVGYEIKFTETPLAQQAASAPRQKRDLDATSQETHETVFDGYLVYETITLTPNGDDISVQREVREIMPYVQAQRLIPSEAVPEPATLPAPSGVRPSSLMTTS